MDFNWSSKYTYLNEYEPGKLNQQWAFNGEGLAPLGIDKSKKSWIRLDLFRSSMRVGVWWGHKGLNQKWDQVKGKYFFGHPAFLSGDIYIEKEKTVFHGPK